LKIVLNSINGNEALITVTKMVEVFQIEPTKTQSVDIKQSYTEENKNQEHVKVIQMAEKDIPKDKLNSDTIVLCSGCESESKCYPFGFRKNGNYCDDKTSNFIKQNIPNSACQNNFECDSNICVNNSCVSGNVWQKFLSWFKNLFG